MEVDLSEDCWEVDRGTEGFGTKLRRSHVLHTAFSAAVGATCTAIVATPLDVVKTRMQSHVCVPGNGLRCIDELHYKGTLDALHRIPRAEGFRALWRGLNAAILVVVPSTALYFSFYEILNSSIRSMDEGLGGAHSALFAGAGARVMTATVASPLELARTRIQSGNEGHSTVTQVTRRLVSQYGLRSLWSGLAPTLWRDAPFSAIYWYSYEMMKAKGGFLSRTLDSAAAVYFISGISAGSLAAAVTTPMDVVKTRRQAVQLSIGKSDNTADKTILRSLRLIYKEEGLAGLFTGLGPRIAKVAPSCAIMMTSYELVQRFFQKDTVEEETVTS